MIIGLIPGSFKPYHIGHHDTVITASSECDEVHLYVSLSDRIKNGEAPIYGEDMKIVWQKFIEPILPPNVFVFYGGSPVGNVWNELEKADKEKSENTYVLYSDVDDIKKFSNNSLKKYASGLYASKKIKLRPTKRLASGTMMRQLLKTGDKSKFVANMPPEINGSAVFDLLSQRVKSEHLVKRYIALLIT
jgi:cytidyltransferase-like protein